MKPILKYNDNAKDSSKNLEGEHTSDNFLVLDVDLNDKESSIKIQLMNISLR